MTARSLFVLIIAASAMWQGVETSTRAAGLDASAPAAADAASAPGDHGPGHDPYDLSHGNAGPDLGNPIEWRFDLALASFVIFAVLFLLLRRFAWVTIRDGLDRREQTMLSRSEAAQRREDEAAEQLRLYQAQLANAQEEAEAIRARARRDAEADAETLRRDARDAAARERDRARADIETAKHEAVREITQRAADLAGSLAGRIVRRELSPQDHAAIIAEALERFPRPN